MRRPPICEFCDRLNPVDPLEGPTCKAFPNGIPVEIYEYGFDHRMKFPGDEGIRFLPRKGVDPDAMQVSFEDTHKDKTPALQDNRVDV